MGRSGWVTIIARAEREAARERHKMIVQERRRAKAEAKWLKEEEAREEVGEYENQIAFLTSMHKDCGPVWDWADIVTRQAPDPPQPEHTKEMAAQKEVDSYVPGFFAKLFGTEKKAREKLQHRVAEARKRDEEANRLAADEYVQMKKTHDWLQSLGRSILAGDLDAYKNALQYLSPFAELVESGMTVGVQELRHDVVVLLCEVKDSSMIPKEEKKLTAKGKLSVKNMAAGTYWGIYQDYACGCALRAAREVLAIVPVPRVVVNVAVSGLDTASGHTGLQTILAISLPREVAATMNFSSVDPSDSLKLYPHRSKYKKTAGFEPVEPISADESFITTGSRR